MSFHLDVPRTDSDPLVLDVKPGEPLFVLGANGTGKSSLMMRFFLRNKKHAQWLSGQRQTWLRSNSRSYDSVRRHLRDDSALDDRRGPLGRYNDFEGSKRNQIIVDDLVIAEIDRARSIAAAVDSGDVIRAEELSNQPAPLNVINDLFRLSNLPVVASLDSDEEIVARKSGSRPYSIEELSDGERNALIVAAQIITLEEGALILIDEPERHLHRSIVSPLLTQLVAMRSDCTFVIATHELSIPNLSSGSQSLLVRDCSFDDRTPVSWRVDLVQSENKFDDELRRDVLGGRQKMLFVEGDDGSLDKAIYSLVFPNVSVVAKDNCRDVEHAVSSIRNTESLHWLYPSGEPALSGLKDWS